MSPLVLAALLAVQTATPAPATDLTPLPAATLVIPPGVATPVPIVPGGAPVTIRRRPGPLPVDAHTALVSDSGSTNTAGYDVRVRDDGWATATTAGGIVRRRLDPALAKRLFADLRAAGPLDALPPATCLKSASFGTTLTVAYGGRRSPDLGCAESAHAQALARDAAAIAQAAGVGRVRGNPRRPL